MDTFATSYHSEGHSTNRPPFFNGTTFAYWKTRIRIYVQSIVYGLWMTIMNGTYIPKKLVDGILVNKSFDEWLESDKLKVELNFKAMNLLFCSLYSNECNIYRDVIRTNRYGIILFLHMRVLFKLRNPRLIFLCMLMNCLECIIMKAYLVYTF